MLATAAVIGHEFGLDLLGRVVGSSPDAEETFADATTRARERGDARQLALAALGGRHHETGFRDEPRAALLEEALAGLEERDSVLRVRVLARLTENLHFAAAEDRALRMSDEALEPRPPAR